MGRDLPTIQHLPNTHGATSSPTKRCQEGDPKHQEVHPNNTGSQEHQPPLVYACLHYTTYLRNRVAREALKWKTPYEACFGDAPDLSALLEFEVYEHIYYYEGGDKFPTTRENSGTFLGVAENTGDALTYNILTDETHEINSCSVVRSACNELNKNLRAAPIEGSEDKPPDDKNNKMNLTSISKVLGNGTTTPLPIIDTDHMATQAFEKISNATFVTEKKGEMRKATIGEKDQTTGKYSIKFGDGSEEYLLYNAIINDSRLNCLTVEADHPTPPWHTTAPILLSG